APDWQQLVTDALADLPALILNPRRDDWDATWTQSITNSQFRAQVEWELDALERSRLIGMYLDPGTKAPVSLLELGLYSRSGKMIVCCPEGYWRKGNVEVVCSRFNIPLVGHLPGFIDLLRNCITLYNK